MDYVVKPFDPDVLRSKVAVFVELQRERGERVREARARAEAEAIASTLQRHLLPDRLPEVPALAMAARYRPSERAAQVGGDWYDAIVLPGGRVGLVIGDVVGHGVRAATLMGELRAALRAYAVTEPECPGAVLTLLNSLVARTHSGEMVATLLYMVVDADGGRARFASAGHLPPLLASADGGTRFLEHTPVPPLGVAEHTNFESWEAELSPGATVLLYTDGLVERRGETIDVGLQRLREALGNGPAELEELCSHILARAPGGTGRPGRRGVAGRTTARAACGSARARAPRRARVGAHRQAQARAVAAGDGRGSRRRPRDQAGCQRGLRQRGRARLRPRARSYVSPARRAFGGRRRGPGIRLRRLACAAGSTARPGSADDRAVGRRSGHRADTGGDDGAHAQGALMSSAESPNGNRPPASCLAEIEFAEREGVRVVTVTGELDISNVGALEDATFDLPNKALGIVLDLSSATYIDSATLGLVFKLHRDLRRRGQALRVVCPPGSSVQRVFELAAFERETPPEEDRDAAIAAIRRDVPLRE